MHNFDHEKLNVYQAAIRFVACSSSLLEQVPKSCAVHNQLDRAATSIPLNIAEGNGRYRSADRCRYFDIARGSALESAAYLDVLVAKGIVNQDFVNPAKKMLLEIVSMIVGLIRSNSEQRTI